MVFEDYIGEQNHREYVEVKGSAFTTLYLSFSLLNCNWLRVSIMIVQDQ